MTTKAKQKKAAQATKTMTDLLREALADGGEPIRVTARATGLNHASLLRFARGDSSLRLDLADKLAEHFGITSQQTRHD